MRKIQVGDTEEGNCCYLKGTKKRREDCRGLSFSDMSVSNEQLASEEEFPL